MGPDVRGSSAQGEPHLPAALVDELFEKSHATRWRVPATTFAAALNAAVVRRFRHCDASDEEIERFLRSLHVADLALACACRDGVDEAWDYFVREYRPVLDAAARAMARGQSHDLVEPLFAELYGLPNARGVRASLLAHYHGRARLSTWLRAVLAQRRVDAHRASHRLVPLGEVTTPSVSAVVDPHRRDYVHALQVALDAAVPTLAAEERLRLRLYYGQSMKLAQLGRMFGESEATASRKLDRARRTLREAVEARLRHDGFSAEQIDACFAVTDDAPELDVSGVLSEERP